MSIQRLIVPFGQGDGTPLQCSCPENPMDGGAWWAAVYGVPKGRTRLSDFTFTFHFHTLEEAMATHSHVLAWRIPAKRSLVGCRLRGRTESDRTDATSQRQQHCTILLFFCLNMLIIKSYEKHTFWGFVTSSIV